eukprot:TRINITY_DN2617_c0_g1_i5.p1 TRINITY_DN2617_c0_g1~~TRINITY_DN2617_c0_g1_i5.p1  ORF type:complete len:407 (+),score=78.77 TRINITY_DN2617_c0_g1_i5:23-1222(+)
MGNSTVLQIVTEARYTAIISNMSPAEATIETLRVGLCDGRVLDIPVSASTRAIDVMVKLSEMVNMNTFLDFRICLFGNEGVGRMLHFDEVICDSVFVKPKTSRTGRSNSFDNMFGLSITTSIVNFYTIAREDSRAPLPHVVLRKVLLLDKESENATNTEEPIHLKLIADQIFFDLYYNIYCFNAIEYANRAGIYCYIVYGRLKSSTIDELKKRFGRKLLSKIGLIVPETIMKQQPTEVWEEKIVQAWSKMTRELDEYGRKCSQEGKPVDLKRFAQFSLINSVKDLDFYGASLYWVRTHKKTLTEIQRPFLEHFWLGIRHDFVMFLEPEKKRPLEKYMYAAITDVTQQPGAVQLTICSFKYTFETTNGFEIVSLINFYRSLHNLNKNNCLLYTSPSPRDS